MMELLTKYMKYIIIVEGNVHEEGNKSSLYLASGDLHNEQYPDPKNIFGAVKIFGPYDHSVVLEVKNNLQKFLSAQNHTIQVVETVDD